MNESSWNYQFILDNALKAYKKKTGKIFSAWSILRVQGRWGGQGGERPGGVRRQDRHGWQIDLG